MIRKKMLITWSIAAALFTAATVAINWPLSRGQSISSVNAICASPLGAFAKAFGGSKIIAGCSRVTVLYDIGNYGRWAVAVIAVAITVTALAKQSRNSRLQPAGGNGQ